MFFAVDQRWEFSFHKIVLSFVLAQHKGSFSSFVLKFIGPVKFKSPEVNFEEPGI